MDDFITMHKAWGSGANKEFQINPFNYRAVGYRTPAGPHGYVSSQFLQFNLNSNRFVRKSPICFGIVHDDLRTLTPPSEAIDSMTYWLQDSVLLSDTTGFKTWWFLQLIQNQLGYQDVLQIGNPIGSHQKEFWEVLDSFDCLDDDKNKDEFFKRYLTVRLIPITVDLTKWSAQIVVSGLAFCRYIQEQVPLIWNVFNLMQVHKYTLYEAFFASHFYLGWAESLYTHQIQRGHQFFAPSRTSYITKDYKLADIWDKLRSSQEKLGSVLASGNYHGYTKIWFPYAEEGYNYPSWFAPGQEAQLYEFIYKKGK